MASLLPSEVARLVLGMANTVGADVVGSSLENLNATTTKRFVHALMFLCLTSFALSQIMTYEFHRVLHITVHWKSFGLQ